MEKELTLRNDSQYIKLTQTPVGKLIISLGLPTTISMLITTVYNMADSFFASQISVPAGAAPGVVFALMSILQAFGFMFGHGSGSHISMALGARENKKASQYASTGFFWALFSGLLIMAFGLIFLEPLMILLGSNQEVLPHAKPYAFFILLAAPLMTTSCVLNNILRYEGRANLAMIGLSTGGLLNIALDPLFMFVFKMGTMGAGVATAISQLVSFSILFFIFMAGKTQSKISLKYLTKDFKILGGIILIGLPSLARQGLNSVTVTVMNRQANLFGTAAIAAMGYVSRTASMIFCVGLGIGQGFQPVSAFNYGAKKYSRVKKSSYFTLGFGTAFLGVIALVCFILAPQIISLFGGDSEVIKIGGTALRYYCGALLFFPISVVATMLFQSIGKSVPALVLSLLQSGLIFIPSCLILTANFGIIGIEISQPIAYVLSAFVSLPWMITFLRKLPKDQEDVSAQEQIVEQEQIIEQEQVIEQEQPVSQEQLEKQ